MIYKSGPWSDDEIATLRALWLEVDIDVIARRLGRLPYSVKSKGKNLKLGSRKGMGEKKKVPEDTRLRQLWSSRSTRPEIADKLSRSLSYVNKRAVELGLPPRRTYRQDTSLAAQVQTDDTGVALQLRKLATARFLIDFKRGGYTAEHYRRHCEVHPSIVASEPCLRDNETPRPKHADYQTYMGSTSAMCAEMSQ
jgi:hypothetical protein